MKIYNFTSTNHPIDYKKLFDFALCKKSIMMFIVRNENKEINREFMEIIQSEILKRESVQEWPGTITFGKPVALYWCNLNNTIIMKVIKIIPSLWNWGCSNFPEDLSFVRPNGKPWFISVTHENDAYFILDDNEFVEFTSFWGSNKINFRCEAKYPDKMYLL